MKSKTMRGIPPMAAGLAVIVLLLADCNRVEDKQLLPWFKVRTTITPEIGGFHSSVVSKEYFIKTGAFWHKMDATYGALVVDPNTVLLFHQGSPEIIHQGQRTGQPICEGQIPTAIIPPGTELIDCFNPVAGPALAIANQVRFRRITAKGHVLNDKTVTVEAPGRVFLQPKATFYDDGHTAYFVTYEEKFTPRAECTLIAIDSGDPKVVAGPVKMYVGDCSRESSWTKLLKKQLKHAP